ncbi:MAG: YciI family protein [Terracoccus sp.]
MADTYLYLIREGDWNSDAYLPDAPEPAENADDLQTGFPAHGLFRDAVEAMGARIVGGEALHDSKHGGIVTPGRGDRKAADAVYTDGPFADTTEIVSGFYLVEASSEETARKIAALVPTASTVEWRKVFPMS